MRRFHIENETLIAQYDRVDDKAEEVRSLMECVSNTELYNLWTQLDVSAIYHDCALEGEVISPEELNSALDPRSVTDATNLTLYTAIRKHKQAFERCRDLAQLSNLEYDEALFKSFNLMFSPVDVDPDIEGFRNEIPLHRTYFHEINQAKQIRENMNELISWANDEFDKNAHPFSFAARMHHRFMHIFPYPDTSGKVGRAVMNIYLMRNGFLPAVVHATERQRYYEAIRNSHQDLTVLLIDSEMASLDSAIRFLRRVIVRKPMAR
ncbi:MAG: Fic family protein [Deltaproteobacteria bacterium]|nr:Fic family protein [Deltaproteobacteria bacterium]MBN2673494.1 Fic family protein [Deltaproteobacteria bacterium]